MDESRLEIGIHIPRHLSDRRSRDAEYEAVLAWREARARDDESDGHHVCPSIPQKLPAPHVVEDRPHRRLTCATWSPVLLQDRLEQCRVCSRPWSRS